MAPYSLRGVLSRPTDRRLAVLAVAYLCAVASVVSFALGRGGSDPTRLQILLVATPVFLLYYLCLGFDARG